MGIGDDGLSESAHFTILVGWAAAIWGEKR